MSGASWLREVLSKRAEELADGDPLFVDESSSAKEVAAAMRERGKCAAVVRFRDGFLGIVTERDVPYRLVAEGLDPNSTPVGRLASRPLESVREGTVVEEAVALMASRGFRRLGVVGADGRLRGLLTLERLLGPGGPALLPVPRVPKGYICPFCGSMFQTKEELSKHIDRAHIGLGLLEGNVSKW
jgi:CBS domain-containing protein